MKRVLLFAVSALIIFGLSSCGGKKAENLADLKKKYDGKEFTDCDKYIEASKEVIDIYIATVEKAAKGDEAAKKEFEEFDAFMEQFGKQQEKFEKECPDKIKAFEEETEKKMEAVFPQILNLVLGDIDLSEDISLDEDMAWDETEENVSGEEEVVEEVTE
ncbi:MAG TPA: hypothetical protein PLG05_01630 [Bacteroidales bacterium]|nr:hypothetical protein [Bacteroidales bacterium]HOR60183.1 hypothetical protein [Bacteroidales bacterium]HPL03856.1 hypothetical protein [Bacteroidales bacterium]HPX75976.1 hypothetical protein [Bacteroidales bacterium]HQB22165.1 hypothetical protein [Bacteroidales bacterium]